MGVELPAVPAAPRLETQEVDPAGVTGPLDAGVPLVAVGALGALAPVEPGVVAGP